MNMRTPKCLLDRDPVMSGVPHVEVTMDFSEYEWMEEIEEFDRQVEQELLEEAFIEACFEEMLAEEEAQWHHFSVPQYHHQGDQHVSMETSRLNSEQFVSDNRLLQVTCSKLNPEAPEFIPRGLMS